MSLRLRADDGSLAAWAPAAPPKVLLLVDTGGARPAATARVRAAGAAVRGALSFIGYEVVDAPAKAADLRVSSVSSSGPLLIVATVSTEGAAGDLAARGFTSEDFHYLCLKTHARAPLALSWDALAAAKRELADLRAAAASLAAVSQEPSARGLTGYRHRFREALQRDFDFPEALSCVWDGLRPGALSPGSKAAFLRAALPALGLVTYEGDGS